MNKSTLLHAALATCVSHLTKIEEAEGSTTSRDFARAQVDKLVYQVLKRTKRRKKSRGLYPIISGTFSLIPSDGRESIEDWAERNMSSPFMEGGMIGKPPKQDPPEEKEEEDSLPPDPNPAFINPPFIRTEQTPVEIRKEDIQSMVRGKKETLRAEEQSDGQ